LFYYRPIVMMVFLVFASIPIFMVDTRAHTDRAAFTRD
jgi:hypothetical protein